MKDILTTVLALVAGFLGGLASHSWLSAPVYAQTAAAPAAEIRSQKFVLVDGNGAARGVFGMEVNGSPAIEITDPKGHISSPRWAARDFFANPPEIPRNPTLMR
jgi:hypothetical protein